MFICVACAEPFESEFVPAFDFRTGKPICEPCDSYRKAWPSRLIFSEVRMAEVDAREVWE